MYLYYYYQVLIVYSLQIVTVYPCKCELYKLEAQGRSKLVVPPSIEKRCLGYLQYCLWHFSFRRWLEELMAHMYVKEMFHHGLNPKTKN